MRTTAAPTWLVVVGTLLGTIALVAAAVLVAARAGAFDWRECECVEGKAPAKNQAGGSDCFRIGRDLPRGYRWERAGNTCETY